MSGVKFTMDRDRATLFFFFIIPFSYAIHNKKMLTGTCACICFIHQCRIRMSLYNPSPPLTMLIQLLSARRSKEFLYYYSKWHCVPWEESCGLCGSQTCGNM